MTLSEAVVTVSDGRSGGRARPVRQLLLGLIAMLLVVGGLVAVQLVRREIWMSDCARAGGEVVRFTDDAEPFVAPGARTTLNCEGPAGTISTWR